MRFFRLSLMLVMLAACAPKNIAQSSCQSHPLTTADEWSCTVTGDIVGQTSSIAFDTESRNHVGHVIIALRVTKGKLRIGYQDLTGEKSLVVTPSEPGNLVMQTRMHPERRSFTLFFEPIDGEVQGLAGTVKYSTP